MTAVSCDERTIATENASYRWAFQVVVYGLLVSTMYRGLVRNEAAWDLLGLVMLGGAVATVYQARHRVLSRQWAVMTFIAMAVAAIVAAGIALAR